MQREGAMEVLASLCSVVGRPGQPLVLFGSFIVRNKKFHVCTAEAILAAQLPLMMETLGDKERTVQLAAKTAIIAFRDMLGDSASMLSLLPALTASFGATKFKTQISALNFVAHIARTLPKQLVGNHMILLVPAIEAMLHDLKDETAAAANACMKVLHHPHSSTLRPSTASHPPQACIDTVRNKDLDPLLPLLLHTMVHVEETADTLYRLGQCVVNIVIIPC